MSAAGDNLLHWVTAYNAVPWSVREALAMLDLDMGSYYVPKVGENPLGEDAHFICPARNAFGVADGVGGWSREGVDAGDFARQLMAFSLAELEAAEEDGFRGDAGAHDHLLRVLQRALAKTTARGTSTACVAAVHGRTLNAVNMGDSGLLVVRGDEVVYHSPPHQREFNMPYQLGRVDEGHPLECAMTLRVELQAGDVVVAASDGLFDNLFDDQVKAVLAKVEADGHGSPAEMARALACAAVKASVVALKTPFAVSCWEERMPWWGGKPDDVTVVVARVL